MPSDRSSHQPRNPSKLALVLTAAGVVYLPFLLTMIYTVLRVSCGHCCEIWFRYWLLLPGIWLELCLSQQPWLRSLSETGRLGLWGAGTILLILVVAWVGSHGRKWRQASLGVTFLLAWMLAIVAFRVIQG